jgi:plasmid stability protein
MKPGAGTPERVRLNEGLARIVPLPEDAFHATMEPFRLQIGVKMPTTLTLKNIPDAVYERLKAAAEVHRRSMNSEAIVCLETVLMPTKMAPNERLARARELRAALPQRAFRAHDIDVTKREGRS